MENYIFKLIVIGDFSVGKTSLINRFAYNFFETDYKPSLGATITKTDMEFVEKKIHIRAIFWDLAGQDRFYDVRNSYYEGSNGCAMVYDITRKETFENIEKNWYKEFYMYIDRIIPFILIGNKNDLSEKRQVPKEKGIELAKKIKAYKFIETSAKTGSAVKETFQDLTLYLVEFLENERIKKKLQLDMK